jgi:hypothetical protein
VSGGEHVESWILGAFPSTQAPRLYMYPGPGQARVTVRPRRPARAAGSREDRGDLRIIYCLYRLSGILDSLAPARGVISNRAAAPRAS